LDYLLEVEFLEAIWNMAIRSFSNRRLLLHGLIRGFSEVEKEIVLDIKRKLQRLNFFFP